MEQNSLHAALTKGETLDCSWLKQAQTHNCLTKPLTQKLISNLSVSDPKFVSKWNIQKNSPFHPTDSF